MRVSPMASAPNMSARWLIDFSPDTRTAPAKDAAGRRATSGMGGACMRAFVEGAPLSMTGGSSPWTYRHRSSRGKMRFMSTVHLVPDDVREHYHVKEWRNAAGVLSTASPAEWQDILEVLRGFRLFKSEVVVGGGNRSLISRRIGSTFYTRGWQEKGFETRLRLMKQNTTVLPMLLTA